MHTGRDGRDRLETLVAPRVELDPLVTSADGTAPLFPPLLRRGIVVGIAQRFRRRGDHHPTHGKEIIEGDARAHLSNSAQTAPRCAACQSPPCAWSRARSFDSAGCPSGPR